jgi:methionyl-tRNA formyltransferase
MDEHLDHGPILLQASAPVSFKDTALTLTQALAELGGRTLLKALDLLEAEAVPWVIQDEFRVTQAPALKKEDGVIHWNKDCLSIHNQIRGVQPWPGALTWASNHLLKIFSTHPDSNRQDPVAKPGTVVSADPIHGLWIQTGKGQIRIDQLQSAGGKILGAAAFLRGHAIPPKSQWASSPAV